MKTPYQLEVISRIKKIREEKGVSQAKLAQHLGISPGQMGNIECYNNTYKYTIKQISVICKVLDISIEQVFGFNGNMSPVDLMDCLVEYQEKQ